jgi:hypothetical protein
MTSSTGASTGAAATRKAVEVERGYSGNTQTAAERIPQGGSAVGLVESPLTSSVIATLVEVETEAVPDVERTEIEKIKALLEKRRKMFLVTALEGARLAVIEGNELCLEFVPEAKHLRDSLSKSDNVKILREVCKEVTGNDLGVRFVVAGQDEADAPLTKAELARREQQDLRATAEKHPTIQQMLRTFRGEIIDVRRAEGE